VRFLNSSPSEERHTREGRSWLWLRIIYRVDRRREVGGWIARRTVPIANTCAILRENVGSQYLSLRQLPWPTILCREAVAAQRARNNTYIAFELATTITASTSDRFSVWAIFSEARDCVTFSRKLPEGWRQPIHSAKVQVSLARSREIVTSASNPTRTFSSLR